MKNILINQLETSLVIVMLMLLSISNSTAQHFGCSGECNVKPDYSMEINTVLPFDTVSRLITVDVRDNIAYFQGDIILGDINELLSRGVSVNGSALWPNSTIPYLIEASDFTNEEIGRINSAVNHVKSQTNLCFVTKSDEQDYVYIRAGTGCSAAVGKKGGLQNIRLSPSCTFGNIVHEILHAAGVYHEQSRSDRNTYITINTGNIIPQKQHNFEIAIGSTNRSSYDYGSIMHYGSHSFSKNGNPTITTKPPGIAIGQRSSLSAGDIATINSMYPVSCRANFWCNDGTKNHGETGIDCGGPCKPCHCIDGTKNHGETGTDCGGPCLPCSTSGPIMFDCEAECSGDLRIDCSAMSVLPETNTMNISNLRVFNHSNINDAQNVELRFSLSDGTVLQAVDPAVLIFDKIPKDSYVVVSPVFYSTGISGSFYVLAEIVGSGNLCKTVNEISIGLSDYYCYNNQQDAGETGVDCGGPCSPCTVCKEDHTLIGTINYAKTYKSSNEIKSEQTLKLFANVIYSAGNLVVMKPGFIAKEGCAFLAQIEGCSGDYADSDDSNTSIDRPLTKEPSLTARPNPFHSSTTLSFQLEQETEIDLSIFDLNGRAIKLLATGIMDQGSYEFKWKAKDLPPGIYLARLVAGQDVQTARIVLTH